MLLAISLLSLMCLEGCAAQNKITLIQGSDFGFCGKDQPPPDCIWFSQNGWNEVGVAAVANIKKKVAQ